MKASESVQKFAPTLRMYANFSARTIKKICSEIGPRECGTEAELKAQNFMAEQVGDAADEVRQEEFGFSHRAFLGWPPIAGILMLIVCALNAVNLFVTPGMHYAPIASAVIIAIVAVMFIGEFGLYKKVLDPFFPKWTSHNTYCIRKPKGEVKRRIIIGGHSDSSLEWTFTHLGGRYFLYFGIGYPVVGLVYSLAASVIMLAKGEVIPVLVYIMFAFVPGFILIIFFLNRKVCVDGANDNLTGCMMGASVLKFMGDNDIRFDNTEVICLFSGGEEEGLRGAKAMAKAHPEFKKDSDVETVFVGFDTIKDYDDMAIYYKDLSGLVKADPQVCALLKKAGQNAGLDLPYASLFFGASDCAAMTQGGIHAALFAAMNPGPPRYYHTRDDKADILDLKCIEKGVHVALETAFIFDEQGLKDNYD